LVPVYKKRKGRERGLADVWTQAVFPKQQRRKEKPQQPLCERPGHPWKLLMLVAHYEDLY
jgi:hypothetical protein